MDQIMVSPTPTEKTIYDVYKQQLESGWSPDGKPVNGASTDKGMAYLHALLTKEPTRNLQRAQSRALAQQQYYRIANQIRADASIDDDNEVFPFLALPTELRLIVYFELLVTNDRLVVTWRGPRKANKQQKRMYIDILRANKQCRNEGLTILYGDNVFDMEEICNRPLSVAKPFLSRIGTHNAALIRMVIAEYSAAVEELHQLPPVDTAAPIPNAFALAPTSLLSSGKPHPHLTLPFLTTFLSAFDITLSRLRVLAISIIPYGFDHATQDLMRQQAPLVMNDMRARVQWLDGKNQPESLSKVVDGICEREAVLGKADYWKDVDAKVGFLWNSPLVGREWVVFKGVRAEEAVNVGKGGEVEGMEVS